MFDVSFGELLLIAVVALLVLGPERMPAAARTVGALLRRARQGWASVRDEVARELNAEELKRKLHETDAEVRRGSDAVGAEFRRQRDDIERAIDPQARDPEPPRE